MKAMNLILAATLAASVLPSFTMAHGYAGKRFFPAMLVVDDPFVSDEAGVQVSRSKDMDNTTTTDLAIDYAKTTTPRFALSIGTDYLHIKPEDGEARNGFGNTTVGGKYLLYKNDAHEALFSAGANVELGGTGSTRVGVESTSTLSPAIFFGKGFGNLPESMKYWRPLVFTGSVSPSFSTHSFNAKSVDTGFTLGYDLGYLQNYVKDVGLKAPFNRLIPIVELPLSTCTTGDCGGQVTGTVNPGFIAQMHFFIDDLFPKTLGKPLFR